MALGKHAEPPDLPLVWQLENFGVDPLHPDDSSNCTAVAVLHLPVLPPFPGHVLSMDAVETGGTRVEALQARDGDLFRRVYALPGSI